MLLYVDGKRLPLTGQDLTNYLESLPAEQIDRIEIITNPGARYEAEGNAGIIDIRLKKDEKQGANGSLNSTVSQGRYFKSNLTGSGNYRKKNFNVFGTAGLGQGLTFHEMDFINDLFDDEPAAFQDIPLESKHSTEIQHYQTKIKQLTQSANKKPDQNLYSYTRGLMRVKLLDLTKKPSPFEYEQALKDLKLGTIAFTNQTPQFVINANNSLILKLENKLTQLYQNRN